VVYKMTLEVMVISEAREAGQCNTVEEQDVIVISVVEYTVEVIREAGAEIVFVALP